MKSSRLRISAESSPSSRLFSPKFWLSQKVFLLIILITACLVPFLLKFSYFSSESSELTLVFNSIIYGIAIWGLVSSALYLAELDVEKAIIQYVEQGGEEYLRKIQNHTGKQSHRANLDDVSRTFVPNNKTQPPLAMTRLFQKICKEAKDRKFESSLYLIQPYQEESIDRLNAISNLQKIALRLGILGTFIGLILAISELASAPLNQLSNANFSDLVGGLFESLYISFSTSISGLVVSIFIGFLLICLRDKQKTYFRIMDDTVVTMLSVVRNSINKDEFLAEFQQVYRVVHELENKVYDHAQKITESVNEVGSKVSSQTDQINEGLGELAKAKSEFDSFLSELSKIQRNFIDETEGVYKIISPHQISEHLRDSIVSAGMNVSNRVKGTEKAIETQTDTIQRGIRRLDETQKEFGAFLDKVSQSQKTFIDDVRTAHDIVQIKRMSDELQSTISQSGGDLSKSMKSNLQDLSTAIYHLNSSLEAHSQLMKQVSYEINREKNRSLLSRIFG